MDFAIGQPPMIHWSNDDAASAASAFVGDQEIGFISENGRAYIRNTIIMDKRYRCVADAETKTSAMSSDQHRAMRAIILMAASAEFLADALRRYKAASMYDGEGLPDHAIRAARMSEHSLEYHRATVSALESMALPSTWLHDHADIIVGSFFGED